MGLAEVKSRRKIDKDPNNTKWSQDANSFGRKILKSQGWEPGQYLGAKDAPQAEHYTAANASFVRVALKDDMLGLGFKRAKEEQVTGMNAFQDMLARLNGKSDAEVQKEKEAQLVAQTSIYCQNKFGAMRFVRGGWLVGDQEQDSPVEKLKKEEDRKEAEASNPKKRKAEEVSDSSDSDSSEDEKAKKKRRKEEKKAAKKAAKASSKSDASGSDEKKRKSKKSKKDRDTTDDSSDDGDDDAATEKKKRKSKSSKKSKKDRKEKKSSDDTATPADSDLDKAARKEKKRLRKEKKRAAEEQSSKANSKSTTAQSTPAGSGTSTPALRGHHAVRSKWIASKRMATMDDAALNQIFMIKAPSS